MLSTFSTKLEFDYAELNGRNRYDIVRFSFIVQHSLSYLNLDLCEYSNAGNSSRSVLDIANDFVSTEEKCRKIFKPTRRLLYTLHLDIPAGREHSLKNVPPVFYPNNFKSQHILRILFMEDFCYHFILARLIECAIKSTAQPLKLLAFMLNFPCMKNSFYQVDSDDLNTIIRFFYPKICDSLVFKGFLEVINLESWIRSYEEPEILDFLLYHACFYGIDLKTRFFNINLVIHYCIYDRVFLNMKSCLKYTDTAGFSLNHYSWHVYEIEEFRPDMDEHVFEKAETLLSKQRIYLILQIICVYIDCIEPERIAASSEAFRLLWNSSPDPFICLEEIRIAFAGTLSEEDISGSFEFYCNSIGEIPSCVEPRTLQQLCRTTIRRTIRENKFCIPEGVELTGLPKRLQAFLNLEEVIPTLDGSRNLLQ